MLWNSVGVVRCYNTDEENSIDVEFHDSNIHHPLHLNNVKNHTMAALSNEGLLLASPKVDDNSSKLECMHFGSWDSNKDWTLEMPKNEEIEAIAVSDDWAACVTDKRLVHLFTISGIQCEVFSIPGAVVCCSARNKQLSIVYHKGSGVEDNQCFNLLLVDVELGGNSRIKDYAVPLTSKAFLSWLGYTDEGHPCIVDTAGIISLLSPNCGSKWIPVANTAQNLKGRSDTYFVIGLSEIKQEIRCILCKGSKYPALLPRPTISVIPFSLPFCEIDTDRGKLEEENARCSLMHKSIQSLLKEGFDLDTEYRAVEKQWMDVLLKMFALATRMDRDCRALDIARLMPNTVIIQGAIRYATQRHKITLAERLSEVMNEKLLESSRIEDDEVELSSPEKSFVSPELPHLKHRSRNYNEEDDVILKPKPLSHVRNESSKSEGFEETMEAGNIKSNETSDLMKDTVSKSSPVSNPFKRSSKGKELRKEELSRQNGIDDIFHNSMKTLAAKANSHTPKDEKQSKKSRFSDHKKEKTQNQESIKPKVGFQLFLDENREKIRTSAESELSEAEIVRTAMKLYKELPPSDKQKYASTANKESTNKAMNGEVPDINNSAVLKDKTEVLKDSEKAVSKKRKENSDDTENNKTEKVKKVKSNEEKLSQTTVNKLTQFAFTRTP
ncbi:WD repeat and HMG-box DNA-binding protein 1, partial [Stegodyphus mimosarum]